MSAHTPGPWFALPDNPKVEAWWHVSDGEDFVCQMFSKHGEFDNAKANASLIAAAPDLLEALKGLHDDVVEYVTLNKLHDADGSPAINNHWMRRARAAIAKATGAPQ